MNKILLSFIFILILSFVISGQNKEARKVTEFTNFGCEELKVQTYDFINELIKTPDSKGYVIVYEGKFEAYKKDKNDLFKTEYALPRFGEAKSRVELIKKQLSFLNYPSKQIVFVIGGFREKLTVEFYVVPKNAGLPKPNPTLNKMDHEKGKAPKLYLGDC